MMPAAMKYESSVESNCRRRTNTIPTETTAAVSKQRICRPDPSVESRGVGQAKKDILEDDRRQDCSHRQRDDSAVDYSLSSLAPVASSTREQSQTSDKEDVAAKDHKVEATKGRDAPHNDGGYHPRQDAERGHSKSQSHEPPRLPFLLGKTARSCETSGWPRSCSQTRRNDGYQFGRVGHRDRSEDTDRHEDQCPHGGCAMKLVAVDSAETT